MEKTREKFMKAMHLRQSLRGVLESRELVEKAWGKNSDSWYMVEELQQEMKDQLMEQFPHDPLKSYCESLTRPLGLSENDEKFLVVGMTYLAEAVAGDSHFAAGWTTFMRTAPEAEKVKLLESIFNFVTADK